MEQLVNNELNNKLIETNFPVEKNSIAFYKLLILNTVATSLLDCWVDSPCPLSKATKEMITFSQILKAIKGGH